MIISASRRTDILFSIYTDRIWFGSRDRSAKDGSCIYIKNELTDYKIEGFFEYVVPPLEGFWWQDNVQGVDYGNMDAFLEENGYETDIMKNVCIMKSICLMQGRLHRKSGKRLSDIRLESGEI